MSAHAAIRIAFCCAGMCMSAGGMVASAMLGNLAAVIWSAVAAFAFWVASNHAVKRTKWEEVAALYKMLAESQHALLDKIKTDLGGDFELPKKEAPRDSLH
jgi:hypothetical protein